nr:hypothetical protein [Torque teno virus]
MPRLSCIRSCPAPVWGILPLLEHCCRSFDPYDFQTLARLLRSPCPNCPLTPLPGLSSGTRPRSGKRFATALVTAPLDSTPGSINSAIRQYTYLYACYRSRLVSDWAHPCK